MIIVADTSALFAAFDQDQAEHEQALQVMETETLVISPLVLTELDHLVHRDLGFEAAMQVTDALMGRLIEGRYKLAELKHVDLASAQSIRSKYEGLRLDLADAVGVALADKYRTDCIFTLDQRDFRAIEPLTPGVAAFRILPADL
ncbi:Predicted nucleic acid-binding protein, contains PIN domain [Nocardia amikacinitolerans]|uniref:Ribonuclease VapC n=1 Tax=Nocardia amikacinitolerans TaxID=756689 RepID=A0A285LWM4_9NOCA|nr:PIN domain-containing protein [Nocardia amikacinitolerans]MCP2277153.1 putative nucleic acid-binding protein, contains PIN domain [Nocardia amikacinitolerans]MCP2295507.1 putative nucleic acid-binding protein, contains PIN domain [Nocardia amikacinitolerans]MCP2318907.1 putative nucleic acid-binding protein, contains PIN domain [Nocardia amikacinitolerans]SNY88056.1 Predicted nucleic acid-binding protein, contains PIN domain [Nocardia amikacinitolerans]